jgi:thiol-disulfide isomerase/thioredoxin
MLELNDKNFKELTEAGKVLVFFYREKGCSFCDTMKPIFEELEGDFVKAKYQLGPTPDSITQGLVESFPTFAAYENGKLVGVQVGAMEIEKLAKTFENGFPEKKPAQIPLEKASMIQLISDEATLIDQIGPLRSHLAKIQKEIAKRKKLAMGKVDCCDSCSDGGDCNGGCH